MQPSAVRICSQVPQAMLWLNMKKDTVHTRWLRYHKLLWHSRKIVDVRRRMYCLGMSSTSTTSKRSLPLGLVRHRVLTNHPLELV